MWIVDDFSDRVTERDEKRVCKENQHRVSWKQKPLVAYDNKECALNFLVERAKERVLKAEKQLAAERRRLKKCEAKSGRKHIGEVEAELGQPYCPKHSPRGITCTCDVEASTKEA